MYRLLVVENCCCVGGQLQAILEQIARFKIPDINLSLENV